MRSTIERLSALVKSPLLPGYLVLITSYLPGVLRTSFWSDDFPAIIETKSTALNLVSDTRPLGGAGLLLFFSIAKLTGFYILPKVVGFVGLLFLYRYTCSLFRKSNSPRIHYLIIAVGFLLPSFGIWSHWSTSLLYSWGALLGLLAYEMFKTKSRIISILTMSISCLIYPSATVFFFGVIFYRGIVLKLTNSELLSEFLSALKLLAISVSLSLIFTFSSMKVLGLSPNSRVSIVSLSEFPHKLIWFFSHPFALGFFPMSVHSPSLLQLVAIGLPVLFGILFVIVRGAKLSKSQFIMRFVLLFAFAVLSICPLLLSRDNQIELRLITGISWAIFCSSLYGAYLFIETYLNNSHRLLSGIFGLTLIIFSIFGVTQRFQTFYFYQDQVATDFIVKSIRICEQSGNLKSINIQENTTVFPVMPYLGTFSMRSDMASSWVPRDRTIFVLKRYFPEYSKVSVVLNSEYPETCNIDLDDFVSQVISSEPKSLL